GRSSSTSRPLPEPELEGDGREVMRERVFEVFGGRVLAAAPDMAIRVVNLFPAPILRFNPPILKLVMVGDRGKTHGVGLPFGYRSTRIARSGGNDRPQLVNIKR
ncbi:hypothetical protein, partial [Methylobacterium radiotolerans]|uniref:hypothetical protein n=1 Tax=Methylobacterium radiotolerans TaxID=31998 RepID=UPI003D210166